MSPDPGSGDTIEIEDTTILGVLIIAESTVYCAGAP